MDPVPLLPPWTSNVESILEYRSPIDIWWTCQRREINFLVSARVSVQVNAILNHIDTRPILLRCEGLCMMCRYKCVLETKLLSNIHILVSRSHNILVVNTWMIYIYTHTPDQHQSVHLIDLFWNHAPYMFGLIYLYLCSTRLIWGLWSGFRCQIK